MKEDALEHTKSLFINISNDDDNSFAIFFKEYYSLIYSTALQYCKVQVIAEDISQQVFLIVWEKRKELPMVDDPLAWLWTIARNQTLNFLRKQQGEKKYINFLREFFQQEDVATPSHQIILKQKTAIIQSILSKLSARQQEVYKLNRHEGLSYKEVAKELCISTETVKEHLAKALQAIRALLQKHQDELFFLLVAFFL